MKKIILMILVSAALLSLVGCGPRRTVMIDTSKTTLTIGNFDGGVGTEWLKSAIEKFEEKYKDTSFENGKKGVQVVIGDNNKTTMEGETLKTLILSPDTKDDLFFTEGVFYQWWAHNGKMLDITQYVNQNLTEFGENKSIAGKIDSNLLSSLTVDGKIYALPFWQSSYGMVYNATLFDEKSWYIGADGGFTNSKGKLGKGPDGKDGTYDDGMPATYDEFFKLLARINKDNCTPIQFPGASKEYLTWLLAQMAADNMGYDQFMLNFSFNGTANLIKEATMNYDTMTFDTEKVQITPKNAYELARQPGFAYTAKFAQTLLQNTKNYNVNNCLSGSFKIDQSQLEFVYNPTASSKKEVAIMVDGNWWENEATAAFQETYGTYATKNDADMEYKWMPFPKANEQAVGSENIMVSPMDAYCFIKAEIAPAKIGVATKFLQFVHTDAQMSAFTQKTGIKKPYNYKVDTSGLTAFTKSFLDAADNARLVFPMDNNSLYDYAAADFRIVHWFSSTCSSSGAYTDQIADSLTQIKGGSYQYTAKDFVDGIYDYRKNIQWPQYASVLK